MENLNLSQYVTANHNGVVGARIPGDQITADDWNGVFGDIQTKINEIIAGMGSGSTIPTPNPDQDDVNQDNPETEFSLKDSEGNYYGRTNGVVTLPAGGYYELKGTVNGRIVVDATGNTAPEKDTVIRLKGCSISTTGNSAINYDINDNVEAGGYKRLILELDSDSVNVIEAGDNTGILNEYGAINSENNLTIQGVGYLTINAKNGHGVRGDKVLIAGPHMWINAKHDGIHAAKTLTIADGMFHFGQAKDWFGTGLDGKIDVVNIKIDENSKAPEQMYFDSKLPGTYSSFLHSFIKNYITTGQLIYGMCNEGDTEFKGIRTDGIQSGWYIPVTDLVDASQFGSRMQIENADTKIDIYGVDFIILHKVSSTFAQFIEIGDIQNHDSDAGFGWNSFNNIINNLNSTELIIVRDHISDYNELFAANGEYELYIFLPQKNLNGSSLLKCNIITMNCNMNSLISGSVKQYDSKSDLKSNTNGQYISLTDGVYNITKPFVKVLGKHIGGFSISSSINSDVTVYLYDTYIVSKSQNSKYSIFNYEPSKNKLKIIGEEGFNEIRQVSKTYDAIKSNNDIAIEVDASSQLVITSVLDGVDGDCVKINDVKGTLFIKANLIPVKGNCVIIGPNAKISGDVPVYDSSNGNTTDQNGYYANATSAPDEYKEVKGAVILYRESGSFENMVVTGEAGQETVLQGGYAGIFARQGTKATKGYFGTLDAALPGIIITDYVGATKTINVNNARNLYYKELLNTYTDDSIYNTILNAEGSSQYTMNQDFVTERNLYVDSVVPPTIVEEYEQVTGPMLPYITTDKSSYKTSVGAITDRIIASTNIKGLTLLYTSSNDEIATIDSGGYLEGIAEGSCTITISFRGNDQYAPCSITVPVTVLPMLYPIGLSLQLESGGSPVINGGTFNNVPINVPQYLELVPQNGTFVATDKITWTVSPENQQIIRYFVSPDGTKMLIEPLFEGTVDISVEFEGNDTHFGEIMDVTLNTSAANQ